MVGARYEFVELSFFSVIGSKVTFDLIASTATCTQLQEISHRSAE